MSNTSGSSGSVDPSTLAYPWDHGYAPQLGPIQPHIPAALVWDILWVSFALLLGALGIYLIFHRDINAEIKSLANAGFSSGKAAGEAALLA